MINNGQSKKIYTNLKLTKIKHSILPIHDVFYTIQFRDITYFILK